MRTFGRRSVLAVLVLSLAWAGTASLANAAKPKVPTVKSLLGKEFKLVKVKGKPLLKGKALPLRFFMHASETGQPKKATMAFSGGCNALGARYRVRKGRLSIRGQITGTAMLCRPNTDPWMIRNFRKSMKARTIGKRLILTRPARGIKLVYRQTSQKPTREKPAEKPIEFDGEPATYESLDGKSFESTKVIGQKVKQPIELSFWTGKLNRHDEDGKQVVGTGLGAYLGCNWMGGEYKLEGGQLTWFDVVQTDMGCFDGGNDRDSWLHNFLNQGVEALINGNRLALTSGQNQIILQQK